MNYFNPRLRAEFADWPSGSHKTTAVFEIEQTPKGERATRYTLHPLTGKPSAVKKLTYARRARIVDGDDGKTYIIEKSIYDFISVMRGDMKIQHETIWATDPRYSEIAKLFEGGK